MLFLFTIELFAEIFLSPRFDAGLDRRLIASVQETSASDSVEFLYRYSSDGKRAWISSVPPVFRMQVTVETTPAGLYDSIFLVEEDIGSQPGGGRKAISFRYLNDSLIDTVRFYFNDTLTEYHVYGHDSLGRVASLSAWYRSRGSTEAVLDLLVQYDSTGKDFQISDPGNQPYIRRFEHDAQGRLSRVRYKARQEPAFQTGWSLHYNSAGEWTYWSRPESGSTEERKVFTYLPLDQIVGVIPRRSKAVRPPLPAWSGRNALGRLQP